MSKVLVISSHTDLENDSLANKIIINTLREKELPEAEYLILDKEYPNRDFDVPSLTVLKNNKRYKRHINRHHSVFIL